MANEITVRVTGEDDFSRTMEQGASKGEAAFDKLGEAGGNAEQKFMGVSDSITGTQDVMEGLRTGNVALLATGFADLAGAAEALWSSMGKVIVQVGKKIAAMAADTATTIANTAATVAHTIASVAAQAAAKAWAAAQWLLNAALTANPIGLVVLAIVALVAAFVLAWKHSETFREIVTGAFNLVLSVVQAVWSWVSENWPLLLAILTGPIGIAVLMITRHWDTIKDGVTGVKDWIVGAFTAVVDFFTTLDDKIKGAIGDAIGMLYDIGRDVVQGLFNGLKDKAAEVAGVVGDIAGGIKRGFTGALGIGSPSKVFQQYGQYIVDGLRLGLQSGLAGISTQVDWGTVPDSMWENLKAQGWQGRQGDGAERLYAPSGQGLSNGVVVNVQALDSRSAEEGVARALEGARRRGLI